MKQCTVCNLVKELNSNNYHRNKKSSTGFQSRCKECTREYDRSRYEDNKKKVLDSKKKYYKRNKERISATKKEYRNANLEHVRNLESKSYFRNRGKELQRRKKYYADNRETILDRDRNYYLENREHIIERNSRYAKNNPEKARLWEQRRNARKANLPHTLTLEEWGQSLEDFDSRCAYCGVKPSRGDSKLTQEHFIPVSFGGGYTAGNIIPACTSCNSSKRDKGFFEWYPRYKYYDEGRLGKILECLEYDI